MNDTEAVEAPYGAPVLSLSITNEIALLTDLAMMAVVLSQAANNKVQRDTMQSVALRFQNRIENLLPREVDG